MNFRSTQAAWMLNNGPAWVQGILIPGYIIDSKGKPVNGLIPQYKKKCDNLTMSAYRMNKRDMI